tara:strand:- start:2169 stop:3620 length:1452 start_codon:yes stop_codon:yes gene_type:complete
MVRYYGHDEGWSQGIGYQNNINNTNLAVLSHNELMDQQIKENNANLNNLKTQTNIATSGNELRKLGQTAMTGVGIKGIKEKYNVMAKDSAKLKEEFNSIGKSVKKSDYALFDNGATQEARFYKKGGESTFKKVALQNDTSPFSSEGAQGFVQEGKTSRVQYFKDTDAGRSNFTDSLSTRENYFSETGRDTKSFKRASGVKLEGDIVESVKLPSEGITDTKSGQRLFKVSESDATRFSVDSPYFTKKPPKGGGSASYYAPESYFETTQGIKPKSTYGVATGTELPSRGSFAKATGSAGGESFVDARRSRGALSGAGRSAETASIEASGLKKASRARRLTQAGEFLESGVGKATRFAGIGASLIGGGIAINEDLNGRWGEFNTAQKWSNGLSIAGSALEVGGLASLNPVLEAGGLLLTLGAGVAGAVGEYQSGEDSKSSAVSTTEKMNAEAESDKVSRRANTSYGNTGAVVSGRYDSRQRIGMAY